MDPKLVTMTDQERTNLNKIDNNVGIIESNLISDPTTIVEEAKIDIINKGTKQS